MTLNEVIDELISIRDAYDFGNMPVMMADGLPIVEIVAFEEGVVLADDDDGN